MASGWTDTNTNRNDCFPPSWIDDVATLRRWEGWEKSFFRARAESDISNINLDSGLSNIFTPKYIVYQDNRTTVVFWKDGSKTVVKTNGVDKFVPEFGFAMAIVKKIFGSRQEFLRIVNAGKYKIRE